MLAWLATREEEMVRLPGGVFRMGSNRDALLAEFPGAGRGLESMLLAETPPHEVRLAPFWMDRYEVTNAQFRRWKPDWQGEPDLPVTSVTWHMAAAYAGWAGKRLPTEAEWEFAASGGGHGAKYPWGNREPAPSVANYAASGRGAPAPVGSYRSNPYGLYDLAGNVWEFCLDPWGPYSAGAVTQTEADLRRMREARAERRVIRGGSYGAGPFNMRVTARDSHRADNPAPHVGFRCARSG